jgi:hypothetical protein
MTGDYAPFVTPSSEGGPRAGAGTRGRMRPIGWVSPCRSRKIAFIRSWQAARDSSCPREHRVPAATVALARQPAQTRPTPLMRRCGRAQALPSARGGRAQLRVAQARWVAGTPAPRRVAVPDSFAPGWLLAHRRGAIAEVGCRRLCSWAPALAERLLHHPSQQAPCFAALSKHRALPANTPGPKTSTMQLWLICRRQTRQRGSRPPRCETVGQLSTARLEAAGAASTQAAPLALAADRQSV